jgi:hypothetical protein
MPPLAFLDECRRHYPSLPNTDLLSKVSYHKGIDDDGDEYDTNSEFREQVCEQLNRDLRDTDRRLVRYLLKQEILMHEESWGVNENIKLCAYLLYRLGHVEDALLIWRAKSTNFDTGCGVDVQLLVGAGLERTVEYLKEQGSKEAAGAISYIEECVKTGDFNNLEGWREFSRNYFGSGA